MSRFPVCGVSHSAETLSPGGVEGPLSGVRHWLAVGAKMISGAIE
jgi:hypothetical protein